MLKLCFVFLLLVALPSTAKAQKQRLLGSAHTVLIQSDVIYNKDRKFHSEPIPLLYVYEAGLLRVFREVQSNPDTIVKFHKDEFLLEQQKISITVFDAEDNAVIYSEERTLVDDRNDVSHLVAHLLAKVRTERDAIAVEEEKHRDARQVAVEAAKAATINDTGDEDAKAFADAEVIVTFYSLSDSVARAILKANRTGPNEFHVYLRYVPNKISADVVLEEKVSPERYTLTLTARDGEVLHRESAPAKLSTRAIVSMSRWINSSPWE
jgi:hypothetical protein